MSDAIIRLLARPRLHLGGRVFSPHAYSLRMFLGEVPTLTVELTDGVSSGPASIFNEGLQEVVAGLERVVGSTAPRVPAALDMVAANNVKEKGAGFQGDTNVLTLITQDEDVSLQLMSKEDAALKILDKILSLMEERKK